MVNAIGSQLIESTNLSKERKEGCANIYVFEVKRNTRASDRLKMTEAP